MFVQPLQAAPIALLHSRRQGAALAYIGDSIRTLIGAVLVDLDKVIVFRPNHMIFKVQNP